MVLSNKQINNFWNKVDKTDDCWNWTGHKLNEQVVFWFKRLLEGRTKVNIYGLAKKLDVDASQLYLIKNNKSWTHVK